MQANNNNIEYIVIADSDDTTTIDGLKKYTSYFKNVI